ncbi:chromatin modification-related protein EAF1 B-like [Impatiens glandulifera]|uniref:chromatin modification-related protein EAF1 B-like n=1 Tax=Impatiens glandulifera TaxID=253017 RepID=UPI001FB08604|nr:chromatin modification-related protein EAF1 B-like [Impatiens glandulifera]XP_047325795.1 chromatin modification-related protein EAF1 B-like [Impatiens glandulifera]
MHGRSLELARLVNADVDSMGEIDGRVGINSKVGPQHPTVQKAQDELRQEYDVREERRRELEFLERGGNPLDYKIVNATSISVQSTSLTNQPHEREAKGSFAQTTSPLGDSVESSGRPGASVACEPNSADNLLLFDGESEFIGGERNPMHPCKNVIAPSEQSSRLQGNQNAKEFEDSAAIAFPKNQAYKRRNRTRPNRENARSSSTDIVQPRTGHVSSMRSGPKDLKVSVVDANNSKDKSVASVCNSKPSSPTGSLDCKATPSHSEQPVPEQDASKGLVDKNPQGNSELPDSTKGSEQLVSAVVIRPQCEDIAKAENNGPRNNIVNDDLNGNATLAPKCFDSDCTPTSMDRNINGDASINLGNVNLEANSEEQIFREKNMVNNANENIKGENKSDGSCGYQSQQGSGRHSDKEVKCSVPLNSDVPNGDSPLGTEGRANDQLRDDSTIQKGVSSGILDSTEDYSPNRTHTSVNASALVEANESFQLSSAAPEQPCPEADVELETKALEDAILEEALTIEAKQKKVAELSAITLPLESRKKSHWDFVLEEMAWLANDFAQERLWKITAAAQLSRQVTFASHLRSKELFDLWKQKKEAHFLAKAVMDFWQLAEEKLKQFQPSSPGKSPLLAVHGYAVRFLKYNRGATAVGQAESTRTPDWTYDPGVMNLPPEDQSQEENLFYKVPVGAMEAYRKSIESYVIRWQSGDVQVETSMHNAATDNIYEEDEGETSAYYLHGGSQSNKSVKFSQKKKKNSIRFYTGRQYDRGADMASMGNRFGNQQDIQMGKRPSSDLRVGPILTKRMRTAPRPRVLGPYSAGSSGGVQGLTRTDASSGDTNSFQDDQSAYPSGLHIPNSLEVESVGDFEKQLPFDSAEVSKPKKKKKAKYSGYEHRWQLDSAFQHERMDQLKRKLESQQLDSNGNSCLLGQHIGKKQKTFKSLDSTLDNHAQTGSSVPSPTTSQMSNMHHPNKIIRILNGRDRSRKSKALKIPAGFSGSESPWSLFEDQALVVLVHDMGPNWELVSDAINNTLQIKCIFRKPNDCKDRHKILMDKTGVDGADSAEDSGSSQPYPSTLPGIPKGSARQLFQHLQDPVEDKMIKTHFEKIVMISQKMIHRKSQNDYIDPKKIQPHASHTLVLQALPNYINGGPPATPLDLCDTPTSSPDGLVLGYQGSHSTNGLAISHPSSVASVLPTSSPKASSIQSSSVAVHGNNFPSPSGPGNTSVRDGRYAVARSAATLPVDEQQRYNQVVSGRNVQSPAAPQGTDRSVVRVGGNGLSAMNRSMPIARTGLQGLPSPSIMSSGSIMSSNMPPVPHPVNIHRSGVGSSQGMLRPRIRPAQNNPEHHMQIPQGNSPSFGGLSPVFTNQASSTSSVQSYPSTMQQQQQQSVVSNSSHHSHLQGQNHSAGNNSPNQNAYRLAKERQLQQRLQQHQQHLHHQPLPPSGAVMTHVPPQPHLPPPTSSVPNSPKVQPQTSLAPASLSPLAQPPSTMTTNISQLQNQKVHTPPPHGFGRTQLSNQVNKQRRRQQQLLQSGRQHLPQRQQIQSQQQAAKLSKGDGKEGNLPPVDSCIPNGISAVVPGTQPSSQGDQAMNSIQDQGLHSGSSKPPGPPHSSNQHHLQTKMHPGQAKQVQHMPTSHLDNNSQGHVHQKLATQKMLQQNRPPDSPNKLQVGKSQIGKPTEVVAVTGISRTSSIDSGGLGPVGSSTSGQGKAPEKNYDSTANSALGVTSVGNVSSANAAGSEMTTKMGKGGGSNNLSPINVQQQQQLSPSMQLPMPHQQQSSNQQVSPRQPPPQQQPDQLPAGNNNMCR